MKNKIIFIAFIIAIIAFFDASALESSEGFRDIKWGTNISTLKDMKLTDDMGDIKFYKKNNDKLKIGEIKVTSISYAFYKGALFIGVISFNGLTTYSTLKDSLFEKYGAGYQANRYMEDYIWGFSDNDPVQVSLKYFEIRQEGLISYKNNIIAKQKEEDEKIKAKNTAKEL